MNPTGLFQVGGGSLTVLSSGNVGIGTTEPSGISTGTNLHLATTGDTFPSFRIERSGGSIKTDAVWNMFIGSAGDLRFRDSTSGNKDPFVIEYQTPDNTVYLDSTGNVGIGTTAPAFKLDVRDTTTTGVFWRHSTGGGTTFANRVSGGTVASPTQTLSGDVNYFLFQGYTGSAGQNMARIGAVAEANIVANDGPSALTFETTSDGTGNVSEKVRITSAGNVGIGTTSPSTKLHISSGTLTIDGNVDTSINAVGDISAARYQINDSTMVAILPGINSIAYGVYAGISNIAGGDYNTFVGNYAGASNTTGEGNSTNGAYALNKNKTGGWNTATGVNALYYNTGNYNTANGNNILYHNTTGNYNTANGHVSLYANTTGSNNTANGQGSIHYNETGSANSIFGVKAGYGVSGSSFSSSTIMGYQAGYNTTTGSDNLLLGFQSGNSLTTGSGNIIIGYDEDAPTVTTNNHLNIGGIIYGDLSTGNVGIGTATPSQKLEVAGNIYATGSLSLPFYSIKTKWVLATSGTYKAWTITGGNSGGEVIFILYGNNNNYHGTRRCLFHRKPTNAGIVLGPQESAGGYISNISVVGTTEIHFTVSNGYGVYCIIRLYGGGVVE